MQACCDAEENICEVKRVSYHRNDLMMKVEIKLYITRGKTEGMSSHALVFWWVFMGNNTCSPQVPGHQSVFINEPRLSDFKQVLLREGIQAEFVGGVLVCNNLVAVRRVSGITLHHIICKSPLMNIWLVAGTLWAVQSGCVLNVCCKKPNLDSLTLEITFERHICIDLYIFLNWKIKHN